MTQTTDHRKARHHDHQARNSRPARSQGRAGRPARAFLEAGRKIAAPEQGTVTWYAFKISDTSYGILDTFETEDARAAHLNGQIPAALGQVASDLLAREPEIRLIDVLAVKLAAPLADLETQEP